MLRSTGKQSGESVESVPKKKREATVGRICRKGRIGLKVANFKCLTQTDPSEC